MKQISLNRNEIEMLIELFNQFKDIETFTIKQENKSGIGPNISVSFDLFAKAQTTVDITDYDSW